VFLSERENFTDFHDNNALIWYLDDLTFGSWTDGPDQDGGRLIDLNLVVPEVLMTSFLPLIMSSILQAVQNNGSWFLHVYLTKAGASPNPFDDYYHNDSVVYQRKCKFCYYGDVTIVMAIVLTTYRRRRINNKVNLLTGESDDSTTSLLSVSA